MTASTPAKSSSRNPFQWDDPFFSLSGAPGAATDLDLFLLDSSGAVVASSTNSNLGSDPFEILSYTNPGATTSFDIVIEKVAGEDPGIVKYIEFDGNITVNEFDTQSSTLFGHANAARAAAVGAAAYFATPVFGVSPPVVDAPLSPGPDAPSSP